MAIVVLGHADRGGVIDADCHLRMQRLADLDRSEHLVLAGGCKAEHSITEAQQMRSMIDAWSGPITLEEWSRTTAENAWCVLELLADEESLQIVCSRAHVFRTWVFFRLAMRDGGKRRPMIFAISRSPSLSSWLYELRWLHHIPRNRRAARTRLSEMLAAA